MVSPSQSGLLCQPVSCPSALTSFQSHIKWIGLFNKYVFKTESPILIMVLASFNHSIYFTPYTVRKTCIQAHFSVTQYIALYITGNVTFSLVLATVTDLKSVNTAVKQPTKIWFLTCTDEKEIKAHQWWWQTPLLFRLLLARGKAPSSQSFILIQVKQLGNPFTLAYIKLCSCSVKTQPTAHESSNYCMRLWLNSKLIHVLLQRENLNALMLKICLMQAFCFICNWGSKYISRSSLLNLIHLCTWIGLISEGDIRAVSPSVFFYCVTKAFFTASSLQLPECH